MAILAIDQGTTSTRALVLNSDGSSRIAHSIAHRQIYPQPGWVEHDPEEIIDNIKACLKVDEEITAIGFDNQGESCLAWHAQTKQAVSPVIVWQDNRTQVSIDKLIAEGVEKLVLEKAGLPLDSYFSASKLAWISGNIPQAVKLHQKGLLRLGTTDAFFMDRLTGKYVTDVTTASRTSLMNLKTSEWDEELCDIFGVPIETLPEIVPTTGDFGEIEIKGKLVPVTASIVDQQASLYGHGCRQSGDTKITFGTGAFALAITGSQLQRSPEQGLLPTIAWQIHGQPPVYALDGGVYNAGSAIEWGRKLGLFDSFDQINQFSKPAVIERELAFVPALSGMACPHWDRSAAGMWIGLSLGTDRSDLIQSILEGVAFRAAEVITAMGEFTTIAGQISIDGGVSVNPFFCQFLANVLERQVSVKPVAELTAIGTAMLAAGETVLIDSDESVRYFYPQADMSQYRETFARAVSRAKAWRS
ncbi:MAG: glycerol kinase [Gammaproteobacteria bacterium]|nr:glycerol kinase [Gammaproteobacteria bacterium]